MGVISDVVVAKKTDANALCEDINSKAFLFEEMRGLQIGEIVALFSVIHSRSVSEALYAEFPLASARDADEGPWAYTIPSALVKRLSELTDDSIPAIAERWVKEASAETIQGVSPKLLEEWLKKLRKLSVAANEKGMTLFLRISL